MKITLLGGPEAGSYVEVDDDPPRMIARDEPLPGREPHLMKLRDWARANGYGRSESGGIVAEAKEQYAQYCEQAHEELPVQGLVFYRLCRWGPGWNLHYVHPDHEAYDVALSY